MTIGFVLFKENVFSKLKFGPKYGCSFGGETRKRSR